MNALKKNPVTAAGIALTGAATVAAATRKAYNAHNSKGFVNSPEVIVISYDSVGVPIFDALQFVKDKETPGTAYYATINSEGLQTRFFKTADYGTTYTEFHETWTNLRYRQISDDPSLPWYARYGGVAYSLSTWVTDHKKHPFTWKTRLAAKLATTAGAGIAAASLTNKQIKSKNRFTRFAGTTAAGLAGATVGQMVSHRALYQSFGDHCNVDGHN